MPEKTIFGSFILLIAFVILAGLYLTIKEIGTKNFSIILLKTIGFAAVYLTAAYYVGEFVLKYLK